MNIPLTPLRFLRYAEQQYPAEPRWSAMKIVTTTRSSPIALGGWLARWFRMACSPEIASLSSAPIATACSKRITAFSKPVRCCFR